MKSFDIVALGEILIDMTYAGKSEAGQTLFEQNPGGAPANVLAAAQRLGASTAFIGKVGNDMHGLFLKSVLERENISTRGLVVDPTVFTTLAFVNLDENANRTFSFARKPGADTCLSSDEVDCDLIRDSKIFHVGSLSLTDEPARSATLHALDLARREGCIITYDPNYRASLWQSREQAVAAMRSIIPMVDLIKISDEETELITGHRSPEAAAESLIADGVSLVIVTMGKDGAYVRTRTGAIKAPAIKTAAVDTTGAGDAFMGGFLYQLASSGKRPDQLTESEISEFAALANRVAAFCVARRGAICAMPTLSEL